MSALCGFAAISAALFLECAWVVRRTPSHLFLGTAIVGYWIFLAAGIHALHAGLGRRGGGEGKASHFARVWQWVILAIALAAGVRMLFAVLPTLGGLGQSSMETLRSSAIAFLISGGLLAVYSSYLQSLHSRLECHELRPLLHLSKFASTAFVAGSGMVFLKLTSGYDLGVQAGWMLGGLGLILTAEPWLRLGLRAYLPARLRGPTGSAGQSALLESLFQAGAAENRFLKNLRRLVGAHFQELWIFRFLADALGPVLLAGLLLGWLSTCFATVGLGSRGVLISLGSYRGTPLQPGLHVTWPWPFERVVSVKTGRLREVGLGFEKEMPTPVLWTEKHVEGERSLLVDRGDGLLTINVPVFYRIADPVRYLTSAADPETTLRNLAERKLTQIAAGRESFHFMTDDRRTIAEALRTSLQAEADRLALGLEIAFVGLKDIHPPMTVAPAYQKVVSSQESKDAMIDQARAYEARTLPAARAQARTLTVNAGAASQKRVSQSSGEAARFEAVSAAERANPGIFRTRYEYDALDEMLPKAPKTIVGIPASKHPEYYLDLRPGSGRGDPAVP